MYIPVLVYFQVCWGDNALSITFRQPTKFPSHSKKPHHDTTQPIGFKASTFCGATSDCFGFGFLERHIVQYQACCFHLVRKAHCQNKVSIVSMLFERSWLLSVLLLLELPPNSFGQCIKSFRLAILMSKMCFLYRMLAMLGNSSRQQHICQGHVNIQYVKFKLHFDRGVLNRYPEVGNNRNHKQQTGWNQQIIYKRHALMIKLFGGLLQGRLWDATCTHVSITIHTYTQLHTVPIQNEKYLNKH